MEKFSGNGAECMVQFIKDGCKGSVCHRAPEGNEKLKERMVQTWKM
jgi:hypothetical protein